MALTIEDGSIVDGADSFATLAECRAYCEARGLGLPADDTELEQLLRRAADFLNSLEPSFSGYRTDSTQALCFPRDNIALYQSDISGTIPTILKQAQSRLAYDASLADLQATGSGRVVKKEAVGPLSVEYADDGASNPQINPTAAISILQPLLVSSSGFAGGFGILVDR